MSTHGLWQKRNKIGNLYLYGKTDNQIMVIYKNFNRLKSKSPHYKIKFIEYSGVFSDDLKAAIENTDFSLE